MPQAKAVNQTKTPPTGVFLTREFYGNVYTVFTELARG